MTGVCRKIVLVILAAVALASCRNDIVYSRFLSMESREWHIDSVAQFDYAIADTAADYRILVYVRHTDRYPYQNMWLFLGDSAHTDTIEFYLANDRGQWLGDRHHGFIEMPVLYEEACHYADTGICHLAVRHAMRDTLLRGITDIGVEVIRNEQ